MGYFDHSKYVSIAMEFRCNLKCVHCMIEGAMDTLIPESVDKFKQIIDFNAKNHQWQGIVLTGSEITLRADLPELAAMARNSGFEHVHIQTNGVRLSDADYCRQLVDAGVDEFFVSVAGPDATSHDQITGVSGSYEKTMAGLNNLEAYENSVTVTNTVVTSQNYHLLPDIVNQLKDLNRLVQMEFWMYWPMSEHDDKNLCAAYTEILPYLQKAIALANSLGRQVELKNFPQCLLGEQDHLLTNDQPQLFIDPSFWPQFMQNGFHQCVYRQQCSSDECLGLSTAYVEKFGWERNILHPI